MIKVYSGKPPDLEAGFEPHLEAVFKTKVEGQVYVKTWTEFYPNGDVVFWMEGTESRSTT